MAQPTRRRPNNTHRENIASLILQLTQTSARGLRIACSDAHFRLTVAMRLNELVHAQSISLAPLLAELWLDDTPAVREIIDQLHVALCLFRREERGPILYALINRMIEHEELYVRPADVPTDRTLITYVRRTEEITA